MITRSILLLLVAAPAFAAEVARAPIGAGRFYPADARELAALVDRHFAAVADSADAGRTIAPEGRVVAVVAPHAGLAYSGALAARALAAARGLEPEVVVVLGTGHAKPVSGAAIHPGGYSAPGVSMRYDAELAKDLLRRTRSITVDAGAHKKEHSIEVLLPYIARVARGAKLVALVVNTQSLEPAREAGRAIGEALRGRKALLVISSDLSHYPPADVAALVDGATLEAAGRLDGAYFWLANRLLLTRGLKTLAVAWCGEGAMTAGLEAARRLGARSARVLERADSGDSVGEKTRVVGYAAVALTTAEPVAETRSREEREELLRAARAAIEGYLKTGKLKIPALSPVARLNAPGAAVVTLRDAKGSVRGAKGSTRVEAPLHEAVARAAVDAAVADARYKPVRADELPRLRLEIAIGSEKVTE